MNEFVHTADATDRLIAAMLVDGVQGSDQALRQLQELRLEHKKTLKRMEELYREQLNVQRFQDVRSADGNTQMWQDNTSEDEADPLNESFAGSFFSDSPIVPYENSFFDFEAFANQWPESYAGPYGSSKVNAPTLESEQREETWTPHITVPEPFRMTIRDDNAPIRANYAHNALAAQLAEADASEAALRAYRFKSKPVPANTFLPIYEELLSEQESREKFRRTHSKERTEVLQRPFKLSVTKRPLHVRSCAPVTHHIVEDVPPFRARPVPPEVREASRYGELEIRGLELSFSAAIHTRQDRKKHRHRDCYRQPPFQPEITRSVPNFQALHAELDNQLLLAKERLSRTTVSEPFNLRIDALLEERREMSLLQRMKEVEAEEPIKRLGGQRRRRSKSPAPVRSVRTNVAYDMRVKARRTAEKEFLDASTAWIRSYVEQKHEWEKELREKLRGLVDIDDARKTRERHTAEQLRKAQEQTAEDYKSKLIEIRERLQTRPSVLERQTTLVREQSYNQRYANTMQRYGLAKSLVNMPTAVPGMTEEVPEPMSARTPRSEASTYQSEKWEADSVDAVTAGKRMASTEVTKVSQTSSSTSSSSSSSTSKSTKSLPSGGIDKVESANHRSVSTADSAEADTVNADKRMTNTETTKMSQNQTNSTSSGSSSSTSKSTKSLPSGGAESATAV